MTRGEHQAPEAHDMNGQEQYNTALLERCLREGERLAHLNAFKSQFLNMVAHDLNNVVTPMRLSLYTLQESIDQGRLAENANSVRLLSRGLDKLLGFLADLLDSARLQSGKLEFRAQLLDLSVQLSQAVEAIKPEARAKGIDVHFDGPSGVSIQAHPRRIEQVTGNLLSNAVKFTPKMGHIAVRLSEDADGVHVEVADTGCGVDPEDLPKLFQPFFRIGVAAQGRHTGTGLGLFICRGIVELHGGRIWCESPGIGRGTTFNVWLPKIAPSEASSTSMK